MTRKTIASKIADVADAERRDKEERVKALRLQAFAWRQVAMIALVDAKKAAGYAKWLFFHTVPYVDGDRVEKFIEDHAEEAGRAGIEGGVFDR